MSNVTLTIGGKHYTVACAAASIRAMARAIRSPAIVRDIS